MTNEINNENPIETTDQSTNEKGKVIMNRLNKIKNHLKNNKKVYIAVGATFVVTAVTTYLVTSRMKVSQTAVNAAMVNWKPTINQNQIVIDLAARGHRGFAIFNRNNHDVYGSIGEAAEKLGVSRTTITNHLKGLIDNINGNVLVNLGENLTEQVKISV